METLDLVQGTPEWFEAKLGLTSVSEFYRFITPKRGDLSAQATSYIADLITEHVEGNKEQINSYWMDRGIALESEARHWYEFQFDTEVKQVGLILNHGAGWSPDGLVGPEGAVEFKCPKPSTHVKWMLEYLATGNVPSEHLPQLHGGFVIREHKWTDFVSYCPGYDSLVARIVPNDYTKKVAAALKKFLEKYDEAKAAFLIERV